jgi:hypothetical protein
MDAYEEFAELVEPELVWQLAASLDAAHREPNSGDLAEDLVLLALKGASDVVMGQTEDALGTLRMVFAVAEELRRPGAVINAGGRDLATVLADVARAVE